MSFWYACTRNIIEAHKENARFSAPIPTTVASSQERDVWRSYTEFQKNRSINVESVKVGTEINSRLYVKPRLYCTTDFQETEVYN